MKSRQEIKEIARQNVAQQRGVAIAMILVSGLVAGIGSIVSQVDVLTGLYVTLIIGMFVAAPINVGFYSGFAKIYRRENTSVGVLFEAFNVNYLRKVGSMALMGLFVLLWSLLLVIPGIIKGIAYSMTPYILAEYPNVKARDAIKLSMRITEGYKAELFVAQLSFLGWQILSAFTCGILYLVFSGPYMYTTFGGYYNELKAKALADGVISQSELEGH